MKKTILSLGILGIVFGFLISAKTFAYRGNPNIYGPNYSPERHEAMEKAFANKDYNSWKELMGDRPITKRITKENFAKFAQIHQLMLEGKIDEANKLRAELGLGQGLGYGRWQRSYNK